MTQARRDRLGAGDEQLDRVLGIEHGHLVLLLAREVKRLATGHEHPHARAAGEQLAQHPDPGSELLEVVEHQQQLAIAQIPLQPLRRGQIRLLGEPERLADRRRDQPRIGDIRKPDKPCPVAVLLGARLRRPQREPRLAATARAGQRHQPPARAPEQRGDLGKLASAAEERRRRDREGGPPRVSAARAGGVNSDGSWRRIARSSSRKDSLGWRPSSSRNTPLSSR